MITYIHIYQRCSKKTRNYCGRSKAGKKKRVFFLKKMFENPQIRQLYQPKMFRKKKKPVGRINPPFFKSSDSFRFFSYLHDSNSIFRAGENEIRRGFGRHGREERCDSCLFKPDLRCFPALVACQVQCTRLRRRGPSRASWCLSVAKKV